MILALLPVNFVLAGERYETCILKDEVKTLRMQYAETDGMPAASDVARFAAGLTLSDGTQCLPALLCLLPEQGACRVTVREGKYHMVRRMLAACGAPVVRLHRESIGGLVLDKMLMPGDFRELTEEETQAVFRDTMPQI